MNRGERVMTCAEFQKALPYFIDTGGNAEQEEHLRSCPVCSDLVADLKYIAEVAKLLVPMEDPPKRVWDGIQRSLERDGAAARPSGPRGRLLSFHSSPASWAIALVVLAALALILTYRKLPHSTDQTSINASAAVARIPVSDDQQVLAVIERNVPSLRATFETNLRSVNTYIDDATRMVQQDPNDEFARQALQRAYEQKTMLYQMALSHSAP